MMFNLLDSLERSQDSTTSDPRVLIWVMGLFASQLLQAVVASKLRWITVSRVVTRVLASQQAEVFLKSLKLPEMATAQNEKGAAKDGKKKGRKSGINLMKDDT
jgi:hypothetical protein